MLRALRGPLLLEEMGAGGTMARVDGARRWRLGLVENASPQIPEGNVLVCTWCFLRRMRRVGVLKLLACAVGHVLTNQFWWEGLFR